MTIVPIVHLRELGHWGLSHCLKLRCVSEDRDSNEAACLSWNICPTGPTAALGIGTRPVLKWAFCYKKISKSSYLQNTLLFTKLIYLCVQADPWTNPAVRRRKPWGIQWGSWHLSAHRRVSDPQAQVSSIIGHCFQLTQMGAFLIGVFRVIWRTSVLCVVVFRKHSLVLYYVLPNVQGKSQCSPCKCSSSYWASQSVCCQQRLDFSTFTGFSPPVSSMRGRLGFCSEDIFPNT